MKFDQIIIGGGLAGATLAYTLKREFGQKVLVIDNNLFRSSSMVAAGIFNPVTGKKMSKTWMADELFPFLHQYYQKVEFELQVKCFYPLKVFKPFDNIEEQNHWYGLSADINYRDFISVIPHNAKFEKWVKSRLGGIEIKYSGYLDVNAYLASIKRYMINEDSFITGNLYMDHIEVTENEIRVSIGNNQIITKKMVFCEGFQAYVSPLWHWLPWQLVKGEVLDIEVKDFQPDTILNKGVFICPIGNQTFKTGSTYIWKDYSPEPTENGVQEIISKLKAYFLPDFKVLNVNSGIRPAVLHRRPFIGKHPEKTGFYIFNGFGSKAVSMAPYFANHFAKNIVKNEKLSEDVDVKRFYDLYPVNA